MKLAHTEPCYGLRSPEALDRGKFTKDQSSASNPTSVPDVRCSTVPRTTGLTQGVTSAQDESGTMFQGRTSEHFRPKCAGRSRGRTSGVSGRAVRAVPMVSTGSLPPLHLPRFITTATSSAPKLSAIPCGTNIRVDRPALLALDTPAVQRLRYIRQVGHTFLVYPGATHTRFEHALGAFHLTRRALAALDELGELGPASAEECLAVRMAALLHDIGHYPFSHALEEAGFPSHEKLGVAKLTQGELGERLVQIGGKDFPAAVGKLISGTSKSPLQGLISGSIDLDKVDYLSRDARMCGVPYGTVDVDRLLSSLTLVEVEPRRYEVGVQEKGISALESTPVRQVQMYRTSTGTTRCVPPPAC